MREENVLDGLIAELRKVPDLRVVLHLVPPARRHLRLESTPGSKAFARSVVLAGAGLPQAPSNSPGLTRRTSASVRRLKTLTFRSPRSVRSRAKRRRRFLWALLCSQWSRGTTRNETGFLNSAIACCKIPRAAASIAPGFSKSSHDFKR